MNARASTPTPEPDEGGFIIIEVLVSAVILALVAGAVLSLITATTRSAGSTRNRSAAYGLAQEDQARLRTMRVSQLNQLEESVSQTVNGTTFSVESSGQFVNNKSGTTSCSSTSSTADYVQITSTVSSSTLLRPVVLQSIISPSSGSLDPAHGTLVVLAQNASEEPLAGVSVTGSGTANFNGSTDANGCAIFADLMSGNYKVTYKATGMITPKGETTQVVEPVGVPAGGTQQLKTAWDVPATVSPEFVNVSPTTGSPVLAAVDSMKLFNSDSGSVATPFGNPGGTRTTALEDKVVYPFKTKYTIYAGSCEGNNPYAKSEAANASGVANLEVKPGAEYRPRIYVPTLNLKVTYNSAIVGGATVVITDTTTNCATVKRAYSTNAEGRQASVTTPAGTVSKGATEAALPYGTYTVCVSANVGGSYRLLSTSNVKLQSVTTPTVLNVSLSSSSATSSSSSSNVCS